MNIQVIAPTFYPDDTYIRYLAKSAERHGVSYRAYGIGQPNPGWIATHITACLKVLYSMESTHATHALFTDASDVIFLQGMDEIQRRYMRLGHPPMLVGTEQGKALNGGGWLGEIPVAIAILEYLSGSHDSGDPQVRWNAAWQKGQIGVRGDAGQVIFSVVHGRVNKQSCIAHFAGGFSDPVTGKADQIEPTWRALGYEQ